MAVRAGNHVRVRPSEERAVNQQVDDCLACRRFQPAEARHLDKRDLQPGHFDEFLANAARDAVEIHGRHWPFSCFAAGAITREVFCWQESGRKRRARANGIFAEILNIFGDHVYGVGASHQTKMSTELKVIDTAVALPCPASYIGQIGKARDGLALCVFWRKLFSHFNSWRHGVHTDVAFGGFQ
jgi:hypothetical protein